jgi:ubiquinone/menaquinone biosynthesis C-methylase UbiE
MKDLYEKLAYDYDEFGSIKDYLGDEKKFFETLFAKFNVKTVLDCACGTGQHLYMLSKMGLNVSGSDYSNSMLEVAQKNMKRLGKKVCLNKCDFRFLEKKHKSKFDAVVCLSTALPHLHKDKDLLLALTSMKNRLNKNGIIVLTQGTTHYNLTLPPIEVIVNREDFTRVFIKEKSDKFYTINVLDLFHSKKRMESNQYKIIYRLLLDKEYKKFLSEGGFKSIKIYGDYNFSKYNRKSKRLIVVAKNE